jgi:hypothetical protein
MAFSLLGASVDSAHAEPKLIGGQNSNGKCYAFDNKTGAITEYSGGDYITIEDEYGHLVVYTCLGGSWVCGICGFSGLSSAELVQVPTPTPTQATIAVGPQLNGLLMVQPTATPTPTLQRVSPLPFTIRR